MKKSIFTTILFLMISVSIFAQQTPQVKVPITISDGVTSQVLNFGLDPSATDGIDAALGELERPPLPPTGVFDARFLLPSDYAIGTLADYRLGSDTTKGSRTYRLQYQVGSGSAITISWDFPTGVSGVLMDMFGGLIVNKAISGTGSYLVPSNLSPLNMIITYNLIAKPGDPTLTLPANNSTGVSATPTLTWNSVTGADTYKLQIATDAGFSAIIKDTSQTGTSYNVTTALANGTIYYWRVSATNTTGTGNYSSVWNFTTIVAKPAAPVLSSPANNSTGVNVTPTLTWNSVTGADTYKLQIATDVNFTSIIKDTSQTGTSYNVTTALSNGTIYYWRVSAANTAGTSNYSSVWDFTTIVAPPAVPTLSSPANNSTGVSVTPTLAWNPVTGADTYKLQIATDVNFTSIIKDTSQTGTSYNVTTALTNGTSYYWRVSAANTAGTSNYSSVWDFTTIVAKPAAPTLSLPANNSTGVSVTPTLTWNAVSGADTYQLQIAADAGFTSIIKDTSQTGTSYNVTTVLTGNTIYYWRVSAGNTGGISNYSSQWNFTTLIVKPAVPTLSSPANNSTGVSVTPTLAWNAVTGADTYKLQIATDVNFTSIIKDTSQTGTSYNVTTALTNGTSYYWRVSAANTAGTSNYSSVWDFTTIVAKPAAPTLSLPANNSTGVSVTPTLTWNAVTGADSYELQIAADAGFTSIIKDTSQTGTSYNVTTVLTSNTIYYWRVSAGNTGGISNYSSQWNFTTLIIKPAAPTLASPLNDSTGVSVTPTLTWNAVTGADTYKLQIATDVNFTSIIKDTSQTGTSYNVTTALTNGTSYYWRVSAANTAGTSNYSSIWDFTTIAAKPAAPTLASPLNDSTGVSVTPTLTWNAVTGADSYKLQIAADSNFTAIIKDTSQAGNNYQVTTALENNTKYYWRVSAANAGGTSNYSSVWNYTTIAAKPAVPTLASPANDSTEVSITPTLTWNAVNGASTYELQIAADSNFTAIIEETSQTGTSYNVTTALTNSTKYYWRVSAANTAGTSNYSSPWNFTTIISASGVPTLASPANNSSGVSINPTLIWNAVTGADTYKLQIAADSNFTAIIKDTSQAGNSYQVTTALTNSTKYYWRVSAANTAGTSNYSSVWNFTTIVAKPAVPSLASPANNSTGVSVTPTLAWNAVTGANTYKLQIATDVNFTSIIKDISQTETSYNVTTALSNSTKYYWRVSASNSGGTSNYSNPWNFTTIIAASGVPTLVFPANNSTGNIPPISLAWNSSDLAISYKLQVSTEVGFGTTILDTTGLTDTTFTLSSLSNSIKYYWRVKAVNTGGESSWSESWNFKMLGEPATVTLLSPIDNAENQPLEIQFVWNKPEDQLSTLHLGEKLNNKKTIKRILKSGNLKGDVIASVSNYWLQLTKDISSTDFVVNDSTLTDTTSTISGLENSTQYFWRVAAKNETGWNNFSDWFSFTTISHLPGIVELISPVDSLEYDSTQTQPEFLWNSDPLAATYNLEISYESNFNSTFFSQDSLTDTLFTPNVEYGGDFYWRVQCSNNAGSGEWSAPNFVKLIITGIEDFNEIPSSYSLSNNYPNPFNPSTVIEYSLPKSSFVQLDIYDVLGNRVQSIVSKTQTAGNYQITFDASNLSSGVYFYRLSASSGASNFNSVKKMILLR